MMGSPAKASSSTVATSENSISSAVKTNSMEEMRQKLPSIHQSPTSTSKSRDFLRTSKLGMVGTYTHANFNQTRTNEQTTPNGLHLQFPSIVPRSTENSLPNKFPAPSLPMQSKSDNASQKPVLLTPAQQQLLDQEHRKNVSSKPQERDTVAFAELDHLIDLNNHEKTLIENYKLFLKNSANLVLSEKQPTAKKFHEEMKMLFHKKTRALGYVLEGHEIPLVFFMFLFGF